MTTALSVTLVAVTLGLMAALVVLVAYRARARRRASPLADAPRRILFPFVGRTLSQSALDSALRLARSEGAVLMPAYLAQVPLSSGLAGPLQGECVVALPPLEAVEQRAERFGVTVDSRIERGRNYRHALRRLLERERYDRIVLAATSENGDGFSAQDVAWLLEHEPGEIAVLRPGNGRRLEPARATRPIPAGPPEVTASPSPAAVTPESIDNGLPYFTS